jgi:predicted nucleic acid-binding protein
MPSEPGIIDANVLVYAMDAEAVQHSAARALVEAARDGSAVLYVTSQIFCEFYSVVTNARRVAKPRSSAEALNAIAGFTAFLHVLPTPARAVVILIDLLRRKPVLGGDVFDLQLVATMQANNIHRIYTFNTEDFTAFSELSVIAPAV